MLRIRKRMNGQTRLATGEKVKVEFSNKVQRTGAKIELISQFHPFIRFISDYLRKEQEAFYPLVAISLPRTKATNIANTKLARDNIVIKFRALTYVIRASSCKAWEYRKFISSISLK